VALPRAMKTCNNISIDYEIQAPADAYLNAASVAPADVSDDGVGGKRLEPGFTDIQESSVVSPLRFRPTSVVADIAGARGGVQVSVSGA